MKDRIKQLMQAQHMNQQTFAQMTGIGAASLSNIFTGRTQPTLMHVTAIHKTFPNINLNWLQFGEGGMFNVANDSGSSNDATSSRSTGDSQGNANDEENSGNSDSYAGMSDNQDIEDLLNSSQNDSFGGGLLPFATDDTPMVAERTQVQRTPSRLPGVRGNNAISQAGRGTQTTTPRPQQASGFGQVISMPASSVKRITEIRVFYDDQTFESFIPKSSVKE